MKNATNIGMLTAVVFAIGMVGFNFSDGTFALQSDAPASNMEASSIMGHIEIIHTDSEGNILSYQQTDNAILNQGRNCAANLLFGPTANDACTDDTPGFFNIVGLSNGTLPSAGDTTQTGFATEIADNNLARADGVVTVSEVSPSTATGDPAIARVSAVFIWQGATTNPVTAAGLFNQTAITNDSVFAMKDFPSTVNMNTGDQLTVNWDITIEGSDAF